MTTATNLWPQDIGETPPDRTPAVVLREQADLLGGLTDGAVLADVEESAGDGDRLRATFLLVVPALRYRYAHFSVSYAPQGYPAAVHWTGGDYPVGDEPGLMLVLSNILRSEPTRRLVATLKQRALDAGKAA
jgi:hypothetical protein